MHDPMKKLFITSIAALFLATGTAHAYVHREFYRCGKYLVTNGSDPRDHWSLLSEQNGRWKMRPLSGRLFTGKGTRTGNIDLGNIYFRKLKCSDVLYRELPDGVIDAIFIKPPPWTENKEPPWTDHIQPPKGDGWEDIEK
jgi:hypothetical protein